MKARYSLAVAVLFSFVVIFTACQTKEVTSAKVYIQQENWDKAIEQLEIAVKLYPQDAEAHYLLGEGYGRKEKWEQMNEQFAKSLEISSEFEQPIKATREKYWVKNFNTGVKMLNNDQVDQAIDKFLTAQKIDSTRADTYQTLAICYTRKQEFEKAKENFKKVIEMQPDNMDAIMGLSQVYFNLQQYEEVIPLMQKALEIEPDNANAVVNLALAYDMTNQTEKAKETYRKALENSPNDTDILYNLGRLHLMNDEFDEAVELFNNVLSENPEDYQANVSVGQSYLQIAQDYQKQLVDKQNEGENVTNEEIERKRELYLRAIPYLQKAVEIGEQSPETQVESAIYYNLGIAYAQTDQPEKAEQAFAKADELGQQ